jgi:hypothetical protein
LVDQIKYYLKSLAFEYELRLIYPNVLGLAFGLSNYIPGTQAELEDKKNEIPGENNCVLLNFLKHVELLFIKQPGFN